MASELSLNQTVQAEVGEFNYVYTENLDVQGEVHFTEDIFVDKTARADRLFVYNKALVSGRIKTQDVELGTFVPKDDPQPGEDLEDFVPFDPPKLLSELFDVNTGGGDISALQTQVDTNTSNISSNASRITALENAPFDSSLLDDLSTDLQALQTRTGTLESLVGLLTNNNTNDTAIEHRISAIEKSIHALKAIYEAKKAVYNIPLDW